MTEPVQNQAYLPNAKRRHQDDCLGQYGWPHFCFCDPPLLRPGPNMEDWGWWV